ncbi:hypothetical protein [Anaeromyxobacter oryzisoli]|jgi:hypothetical protein|uniref:hypothetical protein n=1 Tax=Anaeromyxobacter oryzisoli TaxID=2925408 RepID=UPI001F593B21|nr:hypothetical protein [Anaeromyxobacter sp. SG63]
MKRKIQKATVERPGDVGMDLPPGVTAPELAPADYHPVDMEEPEKPMKRVLRKAFHGARKAAAAARKTTPTRAHR